MSDRSFLVSAVLMVLALALVGFISMRPEPVVIRTNLENLPMHIAGYHGEESRFEESVYQELNADKHVYRHYRAAGGQQIDLYIGYYGTAKGGRSDHNPYACLPGAGWGVVDARKERLQGGAEQKAEVNYVRAKRGEVNTIMLHWYQTSGERVVSTGIRQNIEKFLGRLTRNRNDGAYVQVTTMVADDRIPDGELMAKEFAGALLRLLPGYWPLEK